MRFKRVDAGLRDLLSALVETLPLVQQRCDAEHRERLAVVRAVAARLGPERAALIPAPPRTVLSAATVATELRVTGSHGSELGVELLSLAYRRRYAYSGWTASQLTVAVRQVPQAPAATARPILASTVNEEA